MSFAACRDVIWNNASQCPKGIGTFKKSELCTVRLSRGMELIQTSRVGCGSLSFSHFLFAIIFCLVHQAWGYCDGYCDVKQGCWRVLFVHTLDLCRWDFCSRLTVFCFCKSDALLGAGFVSVMCSFGFLFLLVVRERQSKVWISEFHIRIHTQRKAGVHVLELWICGQVLEKEVWMNVRFRLCFGMLWSESEVDPLSATLWTEFAAFGGLLKLNPKLINFVLYCVLIRSMN